MSGFEHLQQLHCMWINVDFSTERAARFETYTAPIFGSHQRISAVPIPTQDAELQAEADAHHQAAAYTRQYNDPRGFFSSSEFYKKKFMDVDASGHVKKGYVKTYAKTRSLMKSVAGALKMGMEAGWDRWIVAEDDAIPRSLEYAQWPTPPEDADIAVWGGAFPRQGALNDNAMYLAGHPFKWRALEGRHRAEYAHVWEVNQAGAAAMLEALRTHYMNLDNSWWYAFDMCTAYAMRPGAFVQTGASERNQKKSSDKYVGIYRKDMADAWIEKYGKYIDAERKKIA